MKNNLKSQNESPLVSAWPSILSRQGGFLLAERG
jgi:hypothetical protein